MTAYASKRDIYKFGLPRGDAVTFRATEGGTLSAPLVAGTPYYDVIPLTGSFQIAAAPGTGTPISLTSDGVNTGNIKMSAHIWYGFGLALPHAIRRIKGPTR